LAIEQELVTHPDVLEVAVVARGHPKWGERPMAFVTLRPSKASKWENKQKEFGIDLKAHARRRLPGFATPEWVLVVSELPVGRYRSGLLRVTDFLPENLYRKDPES
jgi:acyl-coenzyme A synthetase/AMP-(fatty) acid ligase